MEFKQKFFCCMFKDCFKEYNTKQNLKRHINISHLLKKKSECEICGKEFINSINLKEHYWIHSGAKPYSCEICYLSFRHKSKYGLHKRLHEQVSSGNTKK